MALLVIVGSKLTVSTNYVEDI